MTSDTPGAGQRFLAVIVNYNGGEMLPGACAPASDEKIPSRADRRR